MSPRTIRTARFALILLVILALSGCTTAPAPPLSPGGAAPYPVDPNAPVDPTTGPDPLPVGVSLSQRAQSAMESMVMGAVIGSSLGPLGMAAGAGVMLVYGALTGNVPFQGQGGMGPYDPVGGGAEAQREAALEQEIESEIARGDTLESEIEEELARQEELLHQIDQQEQVQRSAAAAIAPTLSDEELAAQLDPRAAPKTPTDRDLPRAIFEEEEVVIEKGKWGNKTKLTMIKRSLDADRDGKPEQVRYFDPKTGLIIRKVQDRDYDGKPDTWHVYRDGKVVSRTLDTNADGKPDIWETYSGSRMTSRQIDRDNDGVKDAFYTYRGTNLTEEKHDVNNDGKIDLIVIYKNRKRVSTAEDTDKDGAMDSWTEYDVVGEKEVISRIEKDTNSDGIRDVFEFYSTGNGRPELAKREEDKDGDGEVDIISIYENGRLVRREINDPNLVPL